MNAFFGQDGCFAVFFEKTGTLIKLNLITILFCLPIVTIGAAMTAMNYVAMKLDKGEEGYLFEDFFRSFKQNIIQGTLIWLLIAAWLIVGFINLGVAGHSGFTLPRMAAGVISIENMTVLIVGFYAFAVLARFSNTVGRTIKNAFILAFSHIPYTMAVLTSYALPVLFLYYVPSQCPFLFLFGLSLPATISAHFFNRLFSTINTNKEKA